MDQVIPQVNPQSGPSQPQLTEDPSTSSSSKNPMRILLSILVIFIVLVAGIGGGYYFFGINHTKHLPYKPAEQNITDEQASSAAKIWNDARSAIATESAPVTEMAGGIHNKYFIEVPNNWNVTKTTQMFGGKVNSEKIEMSKIDFSDYTLTFLQGGGDGGACSFPDNKITTGVVSGDYTDFVEFKDRDGIIYRRVSNGENTQKTGVTYAICQLYKGIYSDLTTYGWITYNVPKNPNNDLLRQMDAIVSTLKSQ